MKLAFRTSAAAFAALATAGVSTVAFGVAPAAAAPSDGCGGNDLVAPGVCEQVFTTDGTFTPTAQMTQLEVLLVGQGGNGTGSAESATPSPGTVGYASGGGGGDVEIVDFSGGVDPIALVVPTNGTPTSADDGTTSGSAAAGANGTFDGTATANGGASGSGQPGASDTGALGDPAYAAGGGSLTAASAADGGAGTVVSTVAPSGSLFASDARCFGGGGAVGVNGVQGVADCGGGAPVDATGNARTAPRTNSGGGGGATSAGGDVGATGVAIVRWNAGSITLSFSSNGHGAAPAPQTLIAGTAATRPADPKADSLAFAGWYTDASLTTPADFSRVDASTTFYAKWQSALAATGSEPSTAALAGGIGALVVGAGLLLVLGYRRRRQAD